MMVYDKVKVANVVTSLQDARFTLHLPLDGVDSNAQGTTVLIWPSAFRGWYL